MAAAAAPIVGGLLGAAGSSGGSTSSSSQVPGWARPYVQGAASSAQAIYRGGPNQDQSAALDMIRGRANAGNPLLGQAQGAVGGMLNGGPNPYLDRMFNQAADQSRSRFASEFAGGGRDVSASAPFREMELQNLATNIYGGAYENDQQRMLAAAQMAPGLAQADYGDAQALMGAGGFQSQQLDNYIRQLGGAIGNQSVQTQQMSGNPALGFLGGYNLNPFEGDFGESSQAAARRRMGGGG
jgi:hypothetical protein